LLVNVSIAAAVSVPIDYTNPYLLGAATCPPQFQVQGAVCNTIEEPDVTILGLGTASKKGILFRNFGHVPGFSFTEFTGAWIFSDKGEIDYSGRGNDCSSPPGCALTVTGGTGVFEGATGSGDVLIRPTTGVGGVARYTASLDIPKLSGLNTAPPRLSDVPSALTVSASRPAGARVSYAPVATASDGSSVPVVCTPASGSFFSLGETTVTCTATDSAGNTATGSFTVTVEPGKERIAYELATGRGHGAFVASGVIADSGTLSAGRANGATVYQKVTFRGRKGVFRATEKIVKGATDSWTLTSGTRVYRGLHGRGTEIRHPDTAGHIHVVMTGRVTG
jgi:HYR domain